MIAGGPPAPFAHGVGEEPIFSPTNGRSGSRKADLRRVKANGCPAVNRACEGQYERERVACLATKGAAAFLAGVKTSIIRARLVRPVLGRARSMGGVSIPSVRQVRYAGRPAATRVKGSKARYRRLPAATEWPVCAGGSNVVRDGKPHVDAGGRDYRTGACRDRDRVPGFETGVGPGFGAGNTVN